MQRRLFTLLLASALWSVAAESSSSARFDAMVKVRDGVRLATAVALPEGKGPFPAVLQRTPYDKDRAIRSAEAYTKDGIAYVVQDVRGLFASEGMYRAFLDDQEDGYDTVEWIAAQPWSSGKICAVGGSAGGITANLAAMTDPPHLKCGHVTVSHGNRFRYANNSGGAFFQAMVEGWMKGRGVEPSPDPRPLLEIYDEEDRKLDIETHVAEMNTPMYNVGGWFDIFSQGNLDAFMALQQRGGPGARGKQKLIMGPFGHGELGGELKYLERGPDRQTGEQRRWLRHWLLGTDPLLIEEPAVRYYVMGDGRGGGGPGNEWRTAESWPPQSTATRYYLGATGLLSAERPQKSSNASYVYDPLDPVPTIGGQNLNISKGPIDQRPLRTRDDILRYETAPLERPIEIVGKVTADLFVSSDAEDTDFMVKLIDVYPDGYEAILLDQALRLRYRNGLDSWARVKRGEVYRIAVDLWSTAQVFAKGHKIAVHVTSSNHPRFERHSNTWEPVASYDDAVKATNTVFLGGERSSAIVLPVTRVY